MRSDAEIRLCTVPWLTSLVLLGTGVRLLREGLRGFPLDSPGETRLSLARALWEPTRLDFIFQGVHPGWGKSPLFPALLAPAVPAGIPLPLAAHALSALCVASLAPALYLLLAPRAGQRLALAAATAIALLPPILPYAGEYGLAALLLLLVASLAERLLRQPNPALGAGLGLALVLLATARWEGLIQAQALAVCWIAWTLRRPRARLPSLALGLGVGSLVFAALQCWAYPGSGLGQRILERLAINATVVGAFAGQSAHRAAFDTLHAQANGAVGWALRAGLPDPSAVVRALGATVWGALGQVAQLLVLPWLVGAWLGWRALGCRRGLGILAMALLCMLPAAAMPFKGEYLMPVWLFTCALVGWGWGRIHRHRTLAWALLGLAIAAFGTRAAMPDRPAAEQERLDALRVLAERARRELPPGAALRAPEDLCVLLLAERTCQVAVPGEARSMESWWVGETEPVPVGCTGRWERAGLIQADCPTQPSPGG